MKKEKTITVNYIRKLNQENQAYANITITGVNNNKPFDYVFNLKEESNSDIYKTIKQKLDSKELELLPPKFEQSKYKAELIRIKRNSLLEQTDKYMTIDYPLSEDKKTEIKNYRQSLRDITKQKDFPYSVTWPKQPENIKTN